MSAACLELLRTIHAEVRPPVAIVLGAPRQVADLAFTLETSDLACFQMDLYQAERLREELRAIGAAGEVAVAPDLWDLPARFRTVLYPVPARGERELKRDMVEQAQHILLPRGQLLVLSPIRKDDFFPGVMKKMFGKTTLTVEPAGTVLRSPRGAVGPRRRHEITIPVRRRPGPDGVEPIGSSLRICTRPGVFTYGRMDAGARALLDTAEIRPGERVLDVGCGSGVVGVMAGVRAGEAGAVTFVDSNLRAAALAEINARANGLAQFRVEAAATLEGLPAESFDVALANPPYYAQQGIARLFVEGARRVLRRGGRLYLVTKHRDAVAEIVRDWLREPTVHEVRDYFVLEAAKR